MGARVAMAKASNARRVALAILGDVRRNDARARDVLRESQRMRALDERDRALVSRIVLGVTATYGLLDELIDRRLRRPRLEPKVRDALRLGVYEALFCATPAAVAVSQTVELARMAASRSAGLANAVMRRIVEEDVPAREKVLNRVRAGECAADDLAWVSGYPRWLVERVRSDRGAEAASALALSSLEPAPVYVAANAARVSSKEAYDLLHAAGLDPVTAEIEGSFMLRRPAGLARSGLVGAVDVVVSDLSAQHIAAHVGPYVKERLLEVGQGRGTKSVLIQNSLAQSESRVEHVAIDSEAFKVRVSRRRMEVAGLAQSVRCMKYDARDLASAPLPDLLDREFDIVFVDAPCSGSGTIRRHPEIAWALAPADLASIVGLQLEILRAASHRVKRNGSLLYATCSVFRDENEGVVEAFLASKEGARFRLTEKPFQSLPERGGPDGHFCAHLVRDSEPDAKN